MERDALHALIIGVAAEVTDIDLTGVSLDDDLFSLGLDSWISPPCWSRWPRRVPRSAPCRANVRPHLSRRQI